MNELTDNQLIKLLSNYHPYLYHLIKIKWCIFGTLTWNKQSRRRDTPRAESNRRTDFNDLIRAFRIKFGIGRKHLAYYKATEFGVTGEAHVHFLIALKGIEQLSAVECCDALKNLWEDKLKPFDSEICGIGEQTDIRPYDDAKKEHPAAKYCLKREFDERGIERERNDYLSPGLIKLIKKQSPDIELNFIDEESDSNETSDNRVNVDF